MTPPDFDKEHLTFFDPASLTCADLWAKFDWSRLLVFAPDAQPGRKVATHARLKEFFAADQKTIDRPRLFSRLAGPLREGLAAIERKSAYDLGAAMNCYAETLAESGLEARPTFGDRQSLGALPGVCGVKGAGAMQADAARVLIAPGADAAPIIRSALSRSLRLICNGLKRQRGIACRG